MKQIALIDGHPGADHSTLIGNVEVEPEARADWLDKLAELGAQGE